jgi:hypothetical protein
MSRGPWDKETLIPFQIIYFRVPRQYLLRRYKEEDLTLMERVKIQKIRHEAERIINRANHVISVIDSTTRRAIQKDIR